MPPIMGNQKRSRSVSSIEDEEENEYDVLDNSSDSSNSSDVDLDAFENGTDSDTDESIENSESALPADISQNASSSQNQSQESNEEGGGDGEEEDEVIKAIRRENEKQQDHPPTIHSENYVVDLSFHPHEDILAIGNIVGDVVLYKYTNEENTIIKTLELHDKACRDIEFSHDGTILFSTATDKSIMLSNVETGKLIRFYDKSHDVPPYCLTVLNENLFATGDDSGAVKLWDLRLKEDKAIFTIKKNENFISDIVTNEDEKYLVCSSGDGSITTIDLENRKLFMQSEEYDEELTCLGLFRSETKVLAGSSSGKLYLYNWREFGLHSDAFPGPKFAINSLVPITENIVVTACEDGNLRATHLFPHKHLGIVGQHDLSVENVDICNTGKFIASSSHNNDVKFWNIEYFADFESINHKQSKQNKRKEMEYNLPSSKRRNVSDFFSDLS